jgi:site-specific DNA-methyltransferase (adenine-specific)
MEIFNNNCLEKLKEIEDKSVDCFICDLPYGSTACKWDKKIDLDELWREMKRIAKNDNTPYFFFCDMRFAVDLITSNPKMYKYDIVINKRNVVGHLNSRKMPMRKHELLLVFYKKLPTYNVLEYHKKVNKREIYGTNEGIYGKIVDKKYGKIYEPSLPHSIINMDNLNTRGKNHPTEKSQDILEWIIKYYTNEGDTVLDPTMGSGSTGVAAKTLNRNFIGIEMNEEYFEVAKKRIEKIETKNNIIV